MTVQSETEVLIVGAGPAGLVLACDLARRNVRFRLIEKSAVPAKGSRGKGLQPRSQEVFEDLGVLADLQAAGGPYPLLRLYDGETVLGDRAMSEVLPATPDVPYANALMVSQSRTEAILRDRLAQLGGEVEFGVELASFEQDDAGVAAVLRRDDGAMENARAAYLVGADGGRSTVRKALGVGFEGEVPAEGRMIFADVRVEGLARDRWHVWTNADGRAAALAPLAGTDLFQLAVVATDEADLSQAGLCALVAERTGRSDLRLSAPDWVSLWRPNARLAERFRVGRAFLVGDAAHVHPPTGGQGLNTSIQDAYNLGWKLAAVLGGAPAALLDTYEAERRPVAAGVLGLSTRLLHNAQAGDPAATRRGRETQQLDLTYADGPLSLEAPGAGAALRAGDRAPDAPCRGEGGDPVRLFEAFRGPHLTLLTFGDDRIVATRLGAEEASPRLLIDADGHAAAAYGAGPGTQVLVRPDGYVAVVAVDGDGTVEAWLSRWLGPGGADGSRARTGAAVN